MSGECCVPDDDDAELPQAPFQVNVLHECKPCPSDVLGHLHHPLECLVVVYGAIPTPGRDATGQDALDGAVVVFGEAACRITSGFLGSRDAVVPLLTRVVVLMVHVKSS